MTEQITEQDYKLLRHAIQLSEPSVKSIKVDHKDISQKIVGTVETSLSIRHRVCEHERYNHRYAPSRCSILRDKLLTEPVLLR